MVSQKAYSTSHYDGGGAPLAHTHKVIQIIEQHRGVLFLVASANLPELLVRAPKIHFAYERLSICRVRISGIIGTAHKHQKLNLS
jgi:hypothetical protein